MSPEPLYRLEDLHPAYQLRYGWTGWPSNSLFVPELLSRVLANAAPEWEKDGLRVLESALAPEQIQLTVSTTPRITPVILAGRVKGRIQHHLHLSLRGAVGDAPETIALAFLNNLAFVLGQRPFWQAGYYAGTFGEYGMGAVRGKGSEGA